MISTRICGECGQWLSEAVTAMRAHESDMLLSLRLNADGDLTEELRQKFAEVVASFNAAQAAWDAYRQHLEGHGFLLKLAAKGTAG